MKNFFRKVDVKIFTGFAVLLVPAIVIFMCYLLIQAAIIDLLRLVLLVIGILICWIIGHFALELDKKLYEKENQVK